MLKVTLITYIGNVRNITGIIGIPYALIRACLNLVFGRSPPRKRKGSVLGSGWAMWATLIFHAKAALWREK